MEAKKEKSAKTDSLLRRQILATHSAHSGTLLAIINFISYTLYAHIPCAAPPITFVIYGFEVDDDILKFEWRIFESK